MAFFDSYVRAFGQKERIASFAALNELLVRQGEGDPGGNKPFRRRSLQPATVNVSWRFNLGQRFRDRLFLPHCPPGERWIRTINRRRVCLLLLALLTAIAMAAAGYESLFVELEGGLSQYIYFIFYIGLNWYGAYSFYKTLYGALLALRGSKGSPHHPAHRMRQPGPEERCAIIFPVYHEDMVRVGAGIAALIEDFGTKLPQENHRYDIFLLSDSREESCLLQERVVFHELRKRYPHIALYYRRRYSNTNAKLGNVTDFCRRWGHEYHYIYTMDADSVVMADCIHTSLCMMSGNPAVGIIQTNPLPILRTSLFGRMVQFSSHMNGTLFARSLQALTEGHSNYLGHNAIIRAEPFIRHCIMPDLPGSRAAWGGKPLSHDIVESAMMNAAGYQVWFLPELQGSYEEVPANITGFLIRERRWMKGNLQNTRFLLTQGIKSLYNETIFMGAASYLLSPISTFFALVSALASFNVFELRANIQLDTDYSSGLVILLFVVSMAFVILPRAMAIGLTIFSGSVRHYGGFLKMAAGMVLETVFSILFNSLVMFCMCGMIFAHIWQRASSWDSQQRNDVVVPFRQALHDYALPCLVGVGAFWGLHEAIQYVSPDGTELMDAVTDGLASPESMLYWFVPLLGGMVFAPCIVHVSSKTYGLLNRIGIFNIPEELDEPFIIRRLRNMREHFTSLVPATHDGLLGYMFSSPDFYVSHYRHIRSRPQLAARLLPRIRQGLPLSPREMILAVEERACFSALCARHCGQPEV